MFWIGSQMRPSNWWMIYLNPFYIPVSTKLDCGRKLESMKRTHADTSNGTLNGARPGIKPATSLQWGDSINHCATVSLHSNAVWSGGGADIKRERKITPRCSHTLQTCTGCRFPPAALVESLETCGGEQSSLSTPSDTLKMDCCCDIRADWCHFLISSWQCITAGMSGAL